MISPEKTSLNKIKLKTLINFNFKSNTFFIYLLAISLHLYKELREVNVDSSRRRFIFNIKLGFRIPFGFDAEKRFRKIYSGV